MDISCDTCPAHRRQCDSCVVTAFLGLPAPVDEPDWENEDHRVLDLLCSTGLVSSSDAVEARLERVSFGGLRHAV